MSVRGEKSVVTVAHVLHRLYLAGAEVLAAALARQMQGQPLEDGRRFEFIFLCLDEVGPLGEQLAGEGFVVKDLGRQPGIDWGVAKRLGKMIEEYGVNLIHAHQWTPFFYASAGRGLAGRPRILFTEHGRHYPDVRKLKRVVANKVLFRKGDRATAVGEFVKRALIENEGLAAERVEVVYNGVQPGRFMMEADVNCAQREAMRQELGAGDEDLIVLQVARFHPVKDHETAVRAFAGTVNEVPQARLVLVGDGEQRSAMEKLVGELGIEGKVVFAGVRSDIPELMAAADVFMLSSLSEGVSVTILEAMASGLAVAATDVGGNGEVVEDTVTGLLSPRGDHEKLGRNLARLLKDAGMRERMGVAGRERLLEVFTEEQMHRRYGEIYREMV